MTVAIDTDKAIQALKEAGFKSNQARVLIDQLLPAGDSIVTKDFLRAEMQALEARMTAKIYGAQIASVVSVIGALKFFGLF